ncbi:hypothetical protein [Nocardioides panacisoli]|uniref:Uncharacterized protein n=1 Tax=Nocardioides panacisoli TaxID=627624 RepID=A0ABP7IVJ6_9ACTN
MKKFTATVAALLAAVLAIISNAQPAHAIQFYPDDLFHPAAKHFAGSGNYFTCEDGVKYNNEADKFQAVGRDRTLKLVTEERRKNDDGEKVKTYHTTYVDLPEDERIRVTILHFTGNGGWTVKGTIARHTATLASGNQSGSGGWTC